MPQRQCFRPYDQPALTLVQMRQQHLELRRQNGLGPSGLPIPDQGAPQLEATTCFPVPLSPHLGRRQSVGLPPQRLLARLRGVGITSTSSRSLSSHTLRAQAGSVSTGTAESAKRGSIRPSVLCAETSAARWASW